MPSRSTGSGVEAVKSVAMPAIRSGATPAAATAAGTAERSTSIQSSGSCSAHCAGRRSPDAGSSSSITACGYSCTAAPSSSPSAARTTTARPDSVPKSMPMTHSSRSTAQLPGALGPAPSAAARARRYSSTTMSVSSSTDVSAVGLSSAMTPSWIRLTRSQLASTWT